MKLVNLCPHEVAVYGNMKNPVYTLKACESPVRTVYDEEYFGKCVKRKNFIGFDPKVPAPQPGVTYVVSKDVRILLPERKDLASPCADVVKNGEIVGCKWLQIN